MEALTADGFWRWSLAFYGRPRIAETCLTLQDQHGADVNIVLLLLYAAAQGMQAIDVDDAARLEAAVSPWRVEAILPLRKLRRALKGADEKAVRHHVAAAELEAERSAQRRLVQALPRLRSADGPARAEAGVSLRHYDPALTGEVVTLLLDQL